MAVSLTELASGMPTAVARRATVPLPQDAKNLELLGVMLSQIRVLDVLVDKALKNGKLAARPGPYGDYQILFFAKK